MSITVIASAAGLSFYLAPWAAGRVDLQTLGPVLHAHGLKLRGPAQPSLDFVVAEQLSADQADTLRAELQGLGLRVRLDPSPDVQMSRRALLVGLLNGCLFGTLGCASLLLYLRSDPMLYLALLPTLWLLVNTVALQLRGGLPMTRISETYTGQGPLSRALLELKPELPAHLFSELWQQTKALEAQASENPSSQTARDLLAMAEDLHSQNEARVLVRVDQLKEQLEQLQRAVHETQPRPPTKPIL